MKKMGWIGVIAAVMLLAGCASTPARAQEASGLEGDAAYLTELRPRIGAAAALPDAELIALGYTACAEFATGTAQDALRLIDGEAATATGKYADSSAIGYWAAVTYCPEAWD